MTYFKRKDPAAHTSFTETFPGAFRSLFPITERYIYMNHAGVSPISRPARDGMARALEASMTDVPRAAEELDRQMYSARCNAARLVNARPDQIAFLRNTSEGLSAIANGVAWRAGDNLVTTAIEFPANLYPWLRVASAHGVEVRMQEETEGRIDVDKLLTLVDDRTRVVTVSWVQFGTGQRLDIRRIGEFCRDRGILFVVDVVQGLGALQLDVERDSIDAFAGGAHKFLLGPKGIALLYLSDRAVERVQPTVIGWTAVKDYGDYRRHHLEFREGAIRFEGGTLNTVGICGLGKSLELFLEANPERIEQYLLSLNSYLTDALRELGLLVPGQKRPEDRSAIITCRHDRLSAEEICNRLDALGIITSARLGHLRIAPHFYNTQADADALVDALTRL
jgi:cysteine desulfurase/selenocysteine lyase